MMFQSSAAAAAAAACLVAIATIVGGGSGGGVLAFVVPLSSPPPSKQQPPVVSLRMAGIHEPSASLKADENFIKREMLFRQVVKEVNMASEYLDWLVATSGSPSSSDAAVEGGYAHGTAIAATPTIASDDAIELLGGSGGGADGGPSSSVATNDKPPNKPSTLYYKPALRTNLGSTILLSGSEVLDSTLTSILNNNFFGIEDVPNFNFNTIRAIVPNVNAAKKMAIGREARYGGLLDKLVIEPLVNASSSTTTTAAAAGEAAMLPSPTQLEGVSSWIVQLTSSTVHLLPQIATLAKNAAMLKHVVVMIVAHGVDSCLTCKIGWESILDAASCGSSNDGTTTNFAATLLAMDEIYVAQGDTMQRETGYYHIDPIIFDSSTSSSSSTTTTIPPPPPVRRMSARNAYRILGHALALDCTVQKALSVYEYNPTEVECLTAPMAVGEFALRDEVTGDEIPDVYANVKMNGRMIQAMREVGFTPVMELDVLVDKGIAAYKKYTANPDKENAFGSSYSSSSSSSIARAKTARDEQDEKIMAQLEEQSATRRAKEDAEKAKQRVIDIEGIAKEWATKEYTLRMLNGDIDDAMSEKDFLISVWEQALVEGTKAYDFINSEEYGLEKERKQKALVDVEDRLFWDGMPPLMRKKRESMVERVKKQYMDLLSEEELENIILKSTK